MSIPAEDFRSIARILAAGYLRLRDQRRFGEESRSNHKQFLFRRIAWRIQALAEGGLSERAHGRALEIANDADLRIRAPRTRFGQDPALDPKLNVTRKVAGDLDARLPPPGSYLEREYKGGDMAGTCDEASRPACCSLAGASACSCP